MWHPAQALLVAEPDPLLLRRVLLQKVLHHEHDVLPLPEPYHVEALERADDVLGLDPRHPAQVLDLHVLGPVLRRQQRQQDVGPVRPVRDLAEVAQRLLRAAGASLPLAKSVGQADYELPVSDAGCCIFFAN